MDYLYLIMAVVFTKRLISLSVVVMLPLVAWSQTLKPKNVLDEYFLTYDSNTPSLYLTNTLDQRYTFSFYRPMVIDNLQIISFHQSDIQQDITYFIDRHGQTHFRSFAATAPINYGMNHVVRDSFNPYGARDIKAGLMTGVLNALFGSQRIRFVNR